MSAHPDPSRPVALPLPRAAARVRAALAGLALAGLAACAPPPPEPEAPTLLSVTFAASGDLNPDETGRPSPAVVRVLELTSEDVFRAASIFDLLDDLEGTLGDTLLAQHEVILNPGVALERGYGLSDEARVVGVMVEYQAIETAVWRAFLDITPNELNQLRAGLRADEVVLTRMIPEE